MEPTTLTGYTRLDLDSWPINPSFQDFANFLGLTAKKDSKGTYWDFDEKTIDKIKKVYFWGMVKAQTNDHEKIKEAVYDLQRKIGTNWEGKTLVERLWQHTMFDTNFKSAVEKLSKQIEANEQQKKTKEERPKVNRPQKLQPSETKPVKMKNIKYKTYDSELKVRNINLPSVKSEILEI